MAFPATRLRRLRKTGVLRGLVRETELAVSHLVYPMFVVAGGGPPAPPAPPCRAGGQHTYTPSPTPPPSVHPPPSRRPPGAPWGGPPEQSWLHALPRHPPAPLAQDRRAAWPGARDRAGRLPPRLPDVRRGGERPALADRLDA